MEYNELLESALKKAMEYEYRDVPNPEQVDNEHCFSEEFEEKMKDICSIAEQPYVTIGRRRIRRAVAVALAAVMILAMTAGAIAIQRIWVKWNTSQNDDAGTLDVTFEIDDPNNQAEEFHYVKPVTAEGYIITSEVKHSDTLYEIQYENTTDGTAIYYLQSGIVETTGIGIDNENAEFQEILINGFTGYSYSKNGSNALIWSDGTSLYQLMGSCDMDVLEEMAETIL